VIVEVRGHRHLDELGAPPLQQLPLTNSGTQSATRGSARRRAVQTALTDARRPHYPDHRAVTLNCTVQQVPDAPGGFIDRASVPLQNRRQ
jgi:hypothetical protein